MIQPRVLKGFRDYLPEIMIPKKKLIRKIENVFELFGFVPIDTPALEYTEILLGKGGGETDKQIYRFTDNGGRDVSLRFDLTVPLARFISEHYNELIFPFKRYHIAPVWRGENTQKGRYREFYQCDFDILGSNSINSDIEILLVIKSGLDVIKAGEYIININNRKILNLFLKKLNIQEKYIEILRSIDKIYKIGIENVKKELIDNLKIDFNTIEKLIKLLNLSENKEGIKGQNIFDILNNYKNELNKEDFEIIEETEYIFKVLNDMNILKYFSFNPSITRGLDYYTGIVFETFVLDSIDFGSICSGGRYDNLTSLYSKNIITGVGASFGLDRIISLLESKNLLEKSKTSSECLIINFDNKYFYYYQNIANILRKENISCEIYFDKQKLANQFKYAEKKGIKYAIICGEEEIKNNKFNLKNIVSANEIKSLNIEDIITYIKGNK